MNGSSPAAIQKASMASAWSPLRTNTIPKKTQLSRQSVLLSPLTPSIILTALIMPTPAITVIGTAYHQEKVPMPHIP